jgi:hypothetical protein
MNEVRQTTSGDQVDRLLRNFFQQEMPQSWPSPLSVVRSPPPSRAKSRRWTNRHLGLAASLLFLLIGLGAGSEVLRREGWLTPRTADPALPASAQDPSREGNLLREPPATTPKEPTDTDKPMSLNLPAWR